MLQHRALEPAGQTSVALHVAGVEWTFAVAAVTRVHRDLFVRVHLRGPDVCALTVHLPDQVVLGVTAREILLAACEWLLVRGSDTHGYVELAGRERSGPRLGAA